RVRRPTLFSLWRKARRENSAASRLLGSTSLRFALHGWQRRTPIDTVEFLLERKDKDFVITGDREKLLQLVSVGSRIGKELVVEGDWHSADNVKIAISSALVPSKKAATLARKLTREEPITVWLPCYRENDYDGEHTQGDKNGYTPWIVLRSGEARLDEYDPYGVPAASLRPRLAEEFVKFCGNYSPLSA
ncbi:hypothetical protein, partial [Thiolapillus sp.]